MIRKWLKKREIKRGMVYWSKEWTLTSERGDFTRAKSLGLILEQQQSRLEGKSE